MRPFVSVNKGGHCHRPQIISFTHQMSMNDSLMSESSVCAAAPLRTRQQRIRYRDDTKRTNSLGRL